jgi:hypothetical protein
MTRCPLSEAVPRWLAAPTLSSRLTEPLQYALASALHRTAPTPNAAGLQHSLVAARQRLPDGRISLMEHEEIANEAHARG